MIKGPNYKKIYTDMVHAKYPNKIEVCGNILNKKYMSILDVITLNKILFETDNEITNQKLRSYDEKTVLEILSYQKKNKLNNIQTAMHFKLSRNTITKWKKFFFVKE
ncbi:transposase [Chryseobacterium viscerum]|uniref:Helix-turn-helix domain-containing protein n=1 Tax=Chryseobacterium viscerum TaxID=1037377 RepID=A0A316WJV8_9FLAO|nr:transposase [Chryseobacterium viscerum]KAB1230390.1 helix-turn-helix domain-containing protein [Chryseobacterium viscerum]PWN61692.1 transposase [Chryseobacterium viscerum]